MNTVLKSPLFDTAAYLVWEENQTEKHEYIAGEVFAMAGARRAHVVVAGNIFAALKQALRGSSCQTYISDMKLRVEQMDAFYYPDVMVSCSAQDNKAEQYLSEPTLIAEVLSESTAAFDRGNKFAAYRTLATLQEYVIIDISARSVECYCRTPENDWLLHDYRGDDACTFTSVGVTVPMVELFENVVMS